MAFKNIHKISLLRWSSVSSTTSTRESITTFNKTPLVPKVLNQLSPGSIITEKGLVTCMYKVWTQIDHGSKSENGVKVKKAFLHIVHKVPWRT